MIFSGCATFETTLSANIDNDANTYELAMGYRSEKKFNVLAFGNVGFQWSNIGKAIGTFGLSSDYYFTDVMGISGMVGIRPYKYDTKVQYQIDAATTGTYTDTRKGSAAVLHLGIPFSWHYFKLTPYAGVTFYQKPKFTAGVSLAIRNEGIAVAAVYSLIAVAAGGENDKDEHAHDKNRKEKGSKRK